MTYQELYINIQQATEDVMGSGDPNTKPICTIECHSFFFAVEALVFPLLFVLIHAVISIINHFRFLFLL